MGSISAIAGAVLIAGATFAKFGVPGALLGISIKVVATITLSIRKSALAKVSAVSFASMLLLFGLAITKGQKYPRRIGWLLITGGVALLSTDILEAFSGPISNVMNVAVPAIAILTSALMLWLGILMFQAIQRATAHA